MLEIQRHLDGCRSCAQEYRTARHVKELLRSLRVQEPVGPLEARITQRVIREDAARVWTFNDWPAGRPQAGRRWVGALALSCVALFAITPSFAPPAADVTAAHPVPAPFRSQAAFGEQTPGTVLRASPAALSLLLSQSAPNVGAWRLEPTPADARTSGPDAPPPLADVGAEPLGDPAADGYVALADYRGR